MDLEKIGRFIAECRKEKGITQAQLAEKINITDKAVSKWETGKGLPDVSIMIELCNILGINVNELLSGERLSEENYQEKANENIVNMIKVADKNRRIKNKMILIIVIIIAIFFVYGLLLGIYQSMEVSVGYDEGIMQCEIIDDKIIYKVSGLSVISTEYIFVNSESETLIFFTNKMLLQNKRFSHWETWKSLSQVNKGEEPFFTSIRDIDIKKDIPNCKDKIKIYHTNTSFNKIKKADENELLQIIEKSQLICESK